MPEGVHEAAVVITGEEDWHSKSNLATVEKILNSLRAAMERESTERILLTPTMAGPFYASEKGSSSDGHITKIAQDDIEGWLEREMSLQRAFMGRSTLWIDLDVEEGGPVRPALAMRDSVDSVVVHARRRMCSECGSIVALGVPVCPYCGSKAFSSRVAPDDY
jgi:hypothetical protein